MPTTKDLAEVWLEQHDPEYHARKASWSGRGYKNEILIPYYRDTDKPLTKEERLCSECLEGFSPTQSEHSFCTSKCRVRQFRRNHKKARSANQRDVTPLTLLVRG